MPRKILPPRSAEAPAPEASPAVPAPAGKPVSDKKRAPPKPPAPAGKPAPAKLPAKMPAKRDAPAASAKGAVSAGPEAAGRGRRRVTGSLPSSSAGGKAAGRKAAVPSAVADEVPSAPKPRRGRPPKAPVPAPLPPRRNKAVANAAAAVHGRTVSVWSETEIEEAFTRFEAQDPHPEGELNHSDAFTLLVAVVLSAQATDSGVNKATKGLFAAASTPAAMVALGEDAVARHIRTLGLYRGKAKNVVELSRLLLERHKGVVPQDREALEALPGVGRKTANVVLNIAFGAPTIAVDTHLFRVANRTGLAPGATPLAVELGLEARIPDRFKLHAHHWLILHGRYICKARLPECGRCIVADLCRWPEKHF